MRNGVYTIGHSNHTSERFLELLLQHRVSAVADVRSHPFSRLHPQFNRDSLQTTLRFAGIAYVFLGRELGARSDDSDCYVDGKVQFDRLGRTQLFQEGLSRIIKGSETERIAMMCAEKDPLTCHRTILVARHLADLQIEVRHILADGCIEEHDAALSRLLAELDLPEGDLFQGRDAFVREAYERRGAEIAYTRPQPVEGING